MNLAIVDVFAERPFEGNQLAVVEAAANLTDEAMLAIAREMNFSETTFVTRRSADRATVRIFTPAGELPFAGHPTLGTAAVLADGARSYTLDLAVGPVSVTFDAGIVWLAPPRATFGAEIKPAIAAALLGLEPADLDLGISPRLITCGPRFPVIAVRNLETLRRIRVDHSLQTELGLEGFPFAFCAGGYSADADYAARMLFFDGVSLREDPATGSACAALGQYLHALGARGPRIVEQGFEVRRPSRIYLKLEAPARASTVPVQVGGRVQTIVKGRLQHAPSS